MIYGLHCTYTKMNFGIVFQVGLIVRMSYAHISSRRWITTNRQKDVSMRAIAGRAARALHKRSSLLLSLMFQTIVYFDKLKIGNQIIFETRTSLQPHSHILPTHVLVLMKSGVPRNSTCSQSFDNNHDELHVCMRVYSFTYVVRMHMPPVPFSSQGCLET